VKRKLSRVPIGFVLAAVSFALFYFSLPNRSSPFDYTFRNAEALLHGRLGMDETPPSWLSETIPISDRYYTAFPLGSVLLMLPFAGLKAAHVISSLPSRLVASLIAAALVFVFYRLSEQSDSTLPRRMLLALFPVFATWTWSNLAMAGAWQLALGAAVAGEAGALYFTLVRPKPLAAGICFAIAFGNRTELIVTGPIFGYLLLRSTLGRNNEALPTNFRSWLTKVRYERRLLAGICSAPVALGLLTLAYNYARFGSALEFGYHKIPGVLQEPWYRAGLFAFSAVRWNIHKMLFEGMRDISHFPYEIPGAFGGSIFLACPFLFLLFREGPRDYLKPLCWITIAVLTCLLWLHGNPGGYQFSYRYAIILLPWFFLLLLRNGPRRASATEISLFAISIAINGIATYLFLWTSEVKP